MLLNPIINSNTFTEQMEMMGNISVGLIDEDELKKITMVKEQRNELERERHKEAEFGWEEEKEELLAAIAHTKLENAGLVAELDNFKQQLKDNDEELGMIKSELEAQWDHTEKGVEKLEASEAAKQAAEMERDALKAEVAELEEKIVNMETEWTDTENKQIDLENDIQELWDVKEALEKEREEVRFVHSFSEMCILTLFLAVGADSRARGSRGDSQANNASA